MDFTAARTGFLPRLVEKDYYCSVVLEYLSAACPDVVFKGGTWLAKVHLEFFRLSEDLDFVIPVDAHAGRAERSALSKGLKRAVDDLPAAIAGMTVSQPLKGANNSKQYACEVTYSSTLGPRPERIKVEVGLREPLLLPSVRGSSRTLLLDPITHEPGLPIFSLACIDPDEGLSEKLRAALTRREPAIRDLFDIDHAMRVGKLRADDPQLLELLRAKLAIPDNSGPDVSPSRRAAFERQIAAQLQPVLREAIWRRSTSTVPSERSNRWRRAWLRI
ncbi:MAG TPA: nucleotidyl transferase AbiEii/AbiGii toxin family protein [Planctomycetota bacterium]|nr:nucleotidyl transferase AbiEii/AbiGii toxin family protein [Planctomycetota bacterium]